MSDDIKEIPKTMLIIKSNVTALATVETFLRNRGWKIYSTPNLKEALVQLVQNKPSYVLVSVDHANAKVRSLPKLLNQAFPCATIAFAEKQNSASYKLLNDSATEYRVYPPVTGPAIERCVNKYLKDQQTREHIQSGNGDFKSESGGSKGDNTISIKGGGSGNIEVKGGENNSNFGSDSTSRLLSQFLGEDAGIGSDASSSAKNDPNLVFAQPIEEDSEKGPGYMPNHQDPGSLQGGDSSANGYNQTYVQKGSSGQIGNYNPTAAANDSLAGTQQNPGANSLGNVTQKGDGPGNSLGSAGEGPGAGQDNLSSGSGEESAVPMGSREYRRNQQASTPSWEPAANGDSKDIRVREKNPNAGKSDSLIVRGAHKSLEESVEIRDGVVKEKLQQTTNMACIIVESMRFSGYLVAVMGKDQKIDSGFIDLVKGRLFKFLNDNGEKVAEGDALGLKIKQVDFEPWALEYADFLKTSVHKGAEVAMAFFPRKPINGVLEDSHHHEMAKIGLHELIGDSVVEFDLYVYLPNNNKYVLYTPKGGVFYNKQLDRLKNQGITHMHVQKDAAKDVSRYQAQNYLNGLVDDHGKKQSSDSKDKAS